MMSVTSRTAPLSAIVRNMSPAIMSWWADSTIHARSDWWKRIRCDAVGAIRQAVESTVPISVT